MKIKHIKDFLMQQMEQGKQIYAKVKVVPYTGKSFFIIVDFNKSHHKFGDLGLKNFSGREYPQHKLKLKNGSTYKIVPARFMHEVEFEILDKNDVVKDEDNV